METFKEYNPLDYLMIDIANNYGDADVLGDGEIRDLDKVNFEDRINWFKRQEAQDNLVDLIKTADKPALYYAGLQAYNETLAGNPIGYPVSMDACSSGLQLLAALSNCEKSALRCGVLNTGYREDAYMSLFTDMKANAGTIRLKATRKDMKDGVMTSLYGSKAQPRKLFGEDTPALKLFYSTLEEEIPGAWELNLALKSLWQPFATSHGWTMPDNFEVSMKVESLVTNEVMFLGEETEVYTKQATGSRTGLSLSPNIVHSIDGMIVREMTRRCDYDQNQVNKVLGLCDLALKRKTNRRKTIQGRGRKKDQLLSAIWRRYLKSNFLSARVIDLIDEKNIGLVSGSLVKEMLLTLPKKSFSVLSIHDCFRAHPNNMNELRMQYNYILSGLSASDILSDIATQITGTRQRFHKVGNISQRILNANYALS